MPLGGSIQTPTLIKISSYTAFPQALLSVLDHPLREDHAQHS